MRQQHRCTPSRSISAWDRLLMSSEVQAKCTNSETAFQLGVALELLLDVVLHRLDVVVGGRLDGLDALGGQPVEAVGDGVQRGAGRPRDSAGTSGMPGCAASDCSQRTSTSTRRCIRPNSLNTARRSAVLPP